VEALADRGHSVFVEVNPVPVLARSVAAAFAGRGVETTVLPSGKRGEEPRSVLLESLGRLYALGCPVKWEALYPAGRFLPAPAYPWRRERCWLEPARGRAPERPAGDHPFLGAGVPLADAGEGRVWEALLDRRALPFLNDHQVQGAVVLPSMV